MARIRTIKPEFWTSEQNADCSRDARLLFIGLWNFCDDAGRHPASPMRLKMEVLPGDALGTQEVTRWVRELLDAGLLDEYEIDRETYWEVTGWHHQRIDQPNVRHPSRDGKVEPISPRRLGGKQRKLAYSHLVERDGEKCCNCGATNNLAVDHIAPISRGGTNKMDNLRLLCKLCNSEKGAKILAGDAPGTRQVRDGDSPPEGNGMEWNGMEVVSKDTCSELSQATASDPPSEYTFPTNGKQSKEWTLPQAKLAEYRDAFPAIDIDAEMRLARQWCRDNPGKRKTPRGMLGFLTRWLGKNQNSGRGARHDDAVPAGWKPSDLLKDDEK